MVLETTVKFATIDQVQKFVDRIRHIPYDVDACHDNYVVDAKSLLGLLSLSLNRPLKLVLHCTDGAFKKAQNLFYDICEDYLDV